MPSTLTVLLPGLRPVLVKGIQAALTRRSDPPLTKLAPLSPRGKGADDSHPCFRKRVESGPSQKPRPAARGSRKRSLPRGQIMPNSKDTLAVPSTAPVGIGYTAR